MLESTRSPQAIQDRRRANSLLRGDPISLGLVCVLLLGLALRIRFMLSTPLVFDEYNTVYAAQVILERGVPLLPSGYLYIHGLTFSYLEAPFVALSHLLPSIAEFIWRLPGILISMVSALLIYRIGNSLLGRGVGLVAALLLMLMPEAIDWGTRARMYCLLQLLCLLTVYSFYRATQEERSRHLWLFPLLFTTAMLTHLEAALLAPALVAGAIAIGKGRWLFKRRSLIALGLCAMGAALPLLLERLGTTQLAGTSSGLLGIHGDLSRYIGLDPSEIRYYARYLLKPPRLYLTVLFAGALGVTIYSACRASRRGQPGIPAWLPAKPLGLICTVYVVCLLEFVLIVAYHSKDRYLHFLLSIMILPAAWALWNAGAGVVSALTRWRRKASSVRQPPTGGQARNWPALFLAVAAPLLATVPLGSCEIPAASAENPDYTAAFRRVQAQWQEGDIILSPSVASVLYLGKLDYYVLENAAGAIVESPEGQLNSNSGAPRLRGEEDLTRVLDSDARVWVVSDEERFITDATDEYRDLIYETMTLAWSGSGMRVYENRRPYRQVADLLSSEADPARDVIVTSRASQFEELYDGPLPIYSVDAAWSQDQVSAFLQSVAENGRRVWYLRWTDPSPEASLGWLDYQLETHAYLRDQWAFVDASLSLYALEDGASFGPAAHVLLAPGWQVGDALRLDQVRVSTPRASWGRKVGVELDWTVLSQPDLYLAETVRVVDDDGRRWGQADVWLLDEQGEPTVEWETGQSVRQYLAVELCPGLSPGTYHLVYDARDRLNSAPLSIRDAQGDEIETAEIGLLEITAAPYQPVLGDDIELTVELYQPEAPALMLTGIIDIPDSVGFGQELTVGLVWRALEAPQEDYWLRLSLAAQDGAVLAEGGYPLAQAGYPTSKWQAEEVIWRYYTLQVDKAAPASTAALSLTLVDADGKPVGAPIRLAEIEVEGHIFEVPVIGHRQEALVGDGIRFLGYDLEEQTVTPGQELSLTLYWQGEQPATSSYKVFTHLLDQSGVLRGQQDSIPNEGRYPTNEWLAGEVIIDRYQIVVGEDAPAGSYALEIGMYDPQQAGARVPLYAADGNRLQDDRLLLEAPLVVN